MKDCCCFAWDADKQKVLCTPRGQRALRYGCNVADNGLFGSFSYTRRLERYADRGLTVAVPGLVPEEISKDLLCAAYIFLQQHDLLLRIDTKSPDSRIMEFAHLDVSKKIKAGGGIQYTTSVRGFARLVVLGSPNTKINEKNSPEFCWCAEHRKATAKPNAETGAVSLVSCDDGQYLVLCDATAVETQDINHEDANYTESPLAAIYSLMEAKFNHDLLVNQSEPAQVDADGWWTGGALQRIGRSMARRDDQKARSMANKTIETQITQNEPLSFIYDFCTCETPFDALLHVCDAAREPLIPHYMQVEDEKFKETFGIHRKLEFREATSRHVTPGDWWTSVYS